MATDNPYSNVGLMTAATSSEKKFKNTFESRCKNRYLTVGQLIYRLWYVAWQKKDLPPDAQAAARERLREMRSKLPGSPRTSVPATS